MSKDQEEIDEERVGELAGTLRTMLDRGLDKHNDWEIVKLIMELAVIAVRRDKTL